MGDKQVPGLTSIADPAGSFGNPAQTPPYQDQETLALDADAGVFNPLDYGASGTGILNDAAGMQQAINAAQKYSLANGGAVLEIPDGTFTCSPTPTITGKHILVRGRGPGSVIQVSSSTMNPLGTDIGLWLDGASDVTIRDVTFDGNFATGAFKTAFGGGWVLPSTVTGATYVSGGASAPAAGTAETWVVTGGSTAGYFNGCVFQLGTANSGYELVKLVSGFGSNTWHVIRGFGLTPTGTPTGSEAIGGVQNQTWDATVATYGAQSTKNYIFSLGIPGSIDANTYLTAGMPLRITNGSRIFVEACHIRNSRTAGVMVDGPWVSGTGLNQVGSPSVDVSILQCHLDHTVDNALFFYKIATGVLAQANIINDIEYSGIAAVTSTRVSVVGNQIRNTGPSVSDSTGIELAGCQRSVVADNLIENAQWAGILFLCSQEGSQPFVPVANSHITNNVITACNAGDFAFSQSLEPSTGIQVSGGDNCSIVNNRVTFCDQGISVDTQARDVLVKGNTIEFNTTIGIQNVASDNVQGTVIDGNTIRYNGSTGGIDGSAAVWKNNIITDNGGLPGTAPNTGSNGITVQAAPAGRAKKETWIIDNLIGDNRNNAVEVLSGFQAASLLHMHGNELYNSESQQYYDGAFAVSSGGAVTLGSASAVFVNGDVGLKVAIDAWTGPITATITAVAGGVATLGTLSTAQPNSISMTNVGFTLLASRFYMNRGLFMDSASSGPFELIGNRIRSLGFPTPNGNVPAGSVLSGNFETNNQSGATPDHETGTGTLSAATTTAVTFGSTLAKAPTAAQIYIGFTGDPGASTGVPFITNVTASGFTINFHAAAAAVGYYYDVDLGR